MALAESSGVALDASPHLAIDQRCARAYCGPAHGVSWAVADHQPPATAVHLLVAGEELEYQLVRHPLTRQPARDRLGNYLYMPWGETLHPAA